jgi:parallel beta-helix repeat protein
MKNTIAILLACSALSPAFTWACDTSHIRYSSSNNRIYIENGGICSPSQIESIVVNKYSSVAPGQLMEQPQFATWIIKAELHVQDGSTLQIHGTTIGGDTDSLLLLSENGSAPYHVKIQAKHGNVDIRSTLVSSWDPAAQGPDTDSSNGRAFIHVNSLEENGVAMESRMDVVDSEVGYLGFYDAESYGLVWKVRGGHLDPTIYDRVEVYGDIRNSYIHHNFMGMYSYGSLGMVIDNNEVAHNESYGIDPHDDSDELVITNNDVHDNGRHGIICSRRCNNLVITGNDSYRNLHGIMLHREVIDTLVENNRSYDNADTGIVIFESHNNIVRNNVVTGNENGIRLSLGSYNNLIEGNTVENSTRNGLYQYGGSDAPETTNGRPSNNVFTGNTVRNNGRLLKIRDSDDILMESNLFEGPTDIEVFESSNIEIVNNDHFFEDLLISVSGTSEQATTASFELDQSATVKIGDNATLTLLNPLGRIFDPDGAGAVTTVAASTEEGAYAGSSLPVNSGMVSWNSEIVALPFWVVPDSGAIQVSQVDPDPLSPSARVRANSGTPTVDFRIGDLSSGTEYAVLKDGEALTTVTASGGEVTFSDQVTATEVEYRIQESGAAIPSEQIAVADTYVRDGLPDSNFGSASTLETKVSGDGYNREAYMYYDISGLTEPVSQAVLSFTGALSRDGSLTTNVHTAPAGWSESTVTWNTRPGYGSALGGVTISGNSFASYEVDVTDYVNQLIAAGESAAGFALINATRSTAVTRIRAKEAGTDVASRLQIIQ